MAEMTFEEFNEWLNNAVWWTLAFHLEDGSVWHHRIKAVTAEEAYDAACDLAYGNDEIEKIEVTLGGEEE